MESDTEVKRGPGRPPKGAPAPMAAQVVTAPVIIEPEQPPMIPQAEAMFPVRLLKNYMPNGEYEVIEAAEAPFSGVHQERKQWAGTVIKLPRAEAIGLIEKKVTETIWTKDGNDRMMSKQVSRRLPLAERADDIPI